jgi:hypothetical protein
METLTKPINSKINSLVIRIHRDDGGEDRVHLFLDAQGFLTGANNLDKLATWNKRASMLSQIPGLQKAIDAAGNTTVTVDPAMQKQFKFFSKENPCWFAGCEELRNAYAAELAELEKDPNCPDCDKSKLINKYLRKVIDAQNVKPA